MSNGLPAWQSWFGGYAASAGRSFAADLRYYPSFELLEDRVQPSASFWGNSVAVPGEPYELKMSYTPTNEGQTTSTWTINWGDGSAADTVVVPIEYSEGYTSAFHVYSGGLPTYTITPTVTDNLGNTQTFDGDSAKVVQAPVATISGDSSVQVGQTYTLYLSYTAEPMWAGEDPVTSWTINWGDGPPEEVVGNPSSVTHVYQDAPNAYLITAVVHTTVHPNVQAGDGLLVDVLIPEVSSSDSVALTEPGTTVVTTPDGTATAIVSREGNYRDPLIVFLAHYQQDPDAGDPGSGVTEVRGLTVLDSNGVQTVISTSYDLRVTNAKPGDVVVVFFSIPQPSIVPVLLFRDPVTGVMLPIKGSTDPRILARFGMTPKIVNDSYMVVFDFSTSFPTLSQLRGTVFSITDVAPFVPNGFNFFLNMDTPTTRNTNNVLSGLQGSDDDGDGPLVGAIAPTQVSQFSNAGNSGGGGDPETENPGRQRRELMNMVESVLQQLGQILGMQTQLLVNPLIVAPFGMNEAVVAMEPEWVTSIPEASLQPALPFDHFSDDSAFHSLPAAPSADEVAPADLFLPALGVPPAWAAVFNRQMAACTALAAMPLLPWAETLTQPEPDRDRSPKRKKKRRRRK